MYTFREERKPKFNLYHSGLVTLALLLLLYVLLPSARQLFALSPEQIAALEQAREEQTRDMVFRFQDAPEDETPPEDARFLSDADRIQRAPDEEAPDEDPDPFSRGSTYELENAPLPTPTEQPQPTVPPSPQQQAIVQPDVRPVPEQQVTETKPVEQPADREQKPEEPEPEEASAESDEEAEERIEETLPDEPTPLETDTADPKAEPTESATEDVREAGAGEIDLPPNAPKPYRRIDREQLLAARKRAVREMDLNKATAGRPDHGARYDNPTGSTSPDIGLTVETNRDDLGAYLKILQQLVKANWRIPNIAKYEVAGVTGISFRIHQDGTITDVGVALSSRFEPLDVASLNAINNTNPPPLPDHVDDEYVPIKFGFYYNMRPNY